MNINASFRLSPRTLAIITACTLAGLSSACVRFPVQLQDATSHLEGPKSFESLGPAIGKACQFNLFYLIPFGGNQLWKAKERAIGDADGLTDVSVDSSIGLAIIGTVACTEVHGTRYRLVEPPPTFQEPPTILEAPPPEELVPDDVLEEEPGTMDGQDSSQLLGQDEAAADGGGGDEPKPVDHEEPPAEESADDKVEGGMTP